MTWLTETSPADDSVQPVQPLMRSSGADPFSVRKLAGHSDVRLTTQTYAHVQADALRRAVGVMDRIGLEGEGGTGTTHRQTTAS
jgi:hypothetical protein